MTEESSKRATRRKKQSLAHAKLFRHMKTTQEIRLAVSLLSDEDAIYYKIVPRGKRTHQSIPTVWDDRYSSISEYTKSWKLSCRKKDQWGR
jgi:hypothetical protein